MEKIVRLVYGGTDARPLWDSLAARAITNPHDAAAWMDMSTLLQSFGKAEDAQAALHRALTLQRAYRIVHGRGTGIRVLAFVTAGDFMVNTPLDFLLSGSDAELILYYVDAGMTGLPDIPDHDIAFVAIGESSENRPVLARLSELLEGWRGPLMNGQPGRIAALTREGVAQMLRGETAVYAPAVHLVRRDLLERVASGERPLSDCGADMAFPIVVRPVDSHAGHGLQQVAAPGDLAAYLGEQEATTFYVSPFIDYRGADGRFAKQRVVLIDGRPYASHLAVSDHWMVHYLNAGMGASADKRATEAAWMDGFDRDYAVRHAAAFEALYRHIGLDYFGIDCAELPDGRLLLFEVDVAMIVHDMDDAATYPYKKPAMRKLFDAMIAAMEKRRGSPA